MFNSDFYPTPSTVAVKMIHRMFQELQDSEEPTILEPSAGKGDLLDFDTIIINPTFSAGL